MDVPGCLVLDLSVARELTRSGMKGNGEAGDCGVACELVLLH